MLSKRQRAYDPASMAPSQRLRLNMGDLFSRNELPANRIGEVCTDINAVAPTELRDLSGPTDKNTAKNISKKLRGKFMKKSSWMPDYHHNMRTWDPKTNKIVMDLVPMQLVHEIVAVLCQHGFKDKLLDVSQMDPQSLVHLRNCETDAGAQLLGLGIWGDGAPTQWDRSESIDVLSLSLPGVGDFQHLRIPLVVLPHSKMCKETWDDVFTIIKWSLTILATGVWPTKRHDGSAWNETDRCRKTPRELIRGALVQVRQDWKFAAEVFGFPAHNTVEGCCWECKCTPAEVHGFLCVCIYREVSLSLPL